MIKAECVRECIWQRRHWKVGEVYTGAETPPSHFRILTSEEEEKPKSGKKRGRKPSDEREDSGTENAAVDTSSATETETDTGTDTPSESGEAGSGGETGQEEE